MFVIKDPVFILYGSVKVRDSVFRDVDWEITVGIFHPIQHTANSFRSHFEPRWPRSKTIRSSYEWKIYIIYHCIIRAKMYFICISMQKNLLCDITRAKKGLSWSWHPGPRSNSGLYYQWMKPGLTYKNSCLGSRKYLARTKCIIIYIFCIMQWSQLSLILFSY